MDCLKKLKDTTGGKVTAEVFHSAQLYPDLNIANALLPAQVDMAAQAAWTQPGILSDCDFCQRPVIHRQPIEVTEPASDGKPGALIIKQIETKSPVKAIGPWPGRGFQNWHTTKKPLNRADDIKGLKIPGPGGAGMSWRVAFFGGIPNTTAWPNVPLALSQATFDGLLSSNESSATAKYSCQDHQHVGQYMPTISAAFWARLTPDRRKTPTDLRTANIAIRGILPFLTLLLIVLGIITYVPALTLWLPRAIYGI